MAVEGGGQRKRRRRRERRQRERRRRREVNASFTAGIPIRPVRDSVQGWEPRWVKFKVV